MNVRKEIQKFAKEEHKEILLWLLKKYPYETQWNFVAACEFYRYGRLSHQVNRIWSPTLEGKVLYDYFMKFKGKK